MRNKSKNRPDHNKVDWSNLIKEGESFRKLKFFSGHFESSKLTNCNFSNVEAKRAVFTNADLSGCNFTHADLEGADFSGANLTHVNFTGALLKNAHFDNAILDGACFIDVNIKMVRRLKLSEVQLLEIEQAKQVSNDTDQQYTLA